MDNRNNELDELINESNSIPERLDYINIRTKARAKGKRRAVFTGSFAGSIASLFLCFVLLINTSTAFAQSVYNIPALRKLVESVSWTNSYQKAFDNEYAQYIGQKCVSGNNELEIEYVIADKANLVLVMKFNKIDAAYQGKKMNVRPDSLIDGVTKERFGYSYSGFRTALKEDELFVVSHSLCVDKFHSSVDLGIILEIYDGNESESISQEKFSFQLELEEKAQERVYKLDKAVDIGGQILYVDSITVYPTCSKVRFRADAGNTEYIKSIELSITNEKGEVWTRDSSLVSTGELTDTGYREYYLGSNYFTSSKHLSLNIKSALMLPKSMARITLDLNNGTMTDGNGIVPDMKLERVDDKGETIDVNIDCYHDYKMSPAISNIYYFSDGTQYERRINSCWGTDNGHVIECLVDTKKPEDGIIILERRQPAYELDLNIEVPIR